MQPPIPSSRSGRRTASKGRPGPAVGFLSLQGRPWGHGYAPPPPSPAPARLGGGGAWAGPPDSDPGTPSGFIYRWPGEGRQTLRIPLQSLLRPYGDGPLWHESRDRDVPVAGNSGWQ